MQIALTLNRQILNKHSASNVNCFDCLHLPQRLHFSECLNTQRFQAAKKFLQGVWGSSWQWFDWFPIKTGNLQVQREIWITLKSASVARVMSISWYTHAHSYTPSYIYKQCASNHSVTACGPDEALLKRGREAWLLGKKEMNGNIYDWPGGYTATMVKYDRKLLITCALRWLTGWTLMAERLLIPSNFSGGPRAKLGQLVPSFCKVVE